MNIINIRCISAFLLFFLVESGSAFDAPLLIDDSGRSLVYVKLGVTAGEVPPFASDNPATILFKLNEAVLQNNIQAVTLCYLPEDKNEVISTYDSLTEASIERSGSEIKIQRRYDFDSVGIIIRTISQIGIKP